MFKEKYPNINFIQNQELFFSYKNFKNNKDLKNILNKFFFDEIYIPSSTVDFSNFEEVYLIVSKIKANKNIFFNCDGETYHKKVNFYAIWFKNILKK